MLPFHDDRGTVEQLLRAVEDAVTRFAYGSARGR
jgi:hypothetical protein